MAKKLKTQKKSNKLGVLGIVTVVVLMGALLFSRISGKKDELAGLQQKEEQLRQQLTEEQTRSQELEEKRIYVKTKKYVEDVAKQLGLVYPNEIIYKPNN